MALEIPEEAARFIAQKLSVLYDAELPGLRPVHGAGLHVTMKFLGNIPSRARSKAVSSLATAAQGFSPVRLHTVGGGVYPGRKRPRVLWVGLGGEVETLRQLSEAIERSMKQAGFPEDTRTLFRPHVTVGRFQRNTPLSTVQVALGHVASIAPENEGHFGVHGLSLMSSTLTPGGAQYDRLAVVSLAEGGYSPS